MKTLLDYINEDLFDINNLDDIVIGTRFDFGEVTSYSNGNIIISVKYEMEGGDIINVIKFIKKYKLKGAEFVVSPDKHGRKEIYLYVTQDYDFKNIPITFHSFVRFIVADRITIKNMNLSIDADKISGYNSEIRLIDAYRSGWEVTFSNCSFNSNSKQSIYMDVGPHDMATGKHAAVFKNCGDILKNPYVKISNQNNIVS